MRAVIIVTVLMLAPLAQGFDDGLPEIREFGSEHVLQLDGGVWSQMQWEDLEGTGFAPLRLVDQSNLLVWRSAEYELPAQIKMLQAPPLGLKFDTVGQEQFDQMRIVFEPRLPIDAVHQIVAEFELLGIHV